LAVLHAYDSLVRYYQTIVGARFCTDFFDASVISLQFIDSDHLRKRGIQDL
jgi:hypothetical protein